MKSMPMRLKACMPDLYLTSMEEGDIAKAVRLISRTMNPDEGRWAEKTMAFHFSCLRRGLDDGRKYYLLLQGQDANDVKGISGLHHYAWGPEENVWLAWFAVAPEWQRQGIGKNLMLLTEEKAVTEGYKTFLAETYNHRDFDKARKFYAAVGFQKMGEISGYLPDGSNMVVYGKRLCF